MTTIEDIAKALREAASLYLLMYQDAGKYEDTKTADLWEERFNHAESLAAKVEQMRCETCDSYIKPCKNIIGPWRQCIHINVSNQGPNFGCWHWKEKEAKQI